MGLPAGHDVVQSTRPRRLALRPPSHPHVHATVLPLDVPVHMHPIRLDSEVHGCCTLHEEHRGRLERGQHRIELITPAGDDALVPKPQQRLLNRTAPLLQIFHIFQALLQPYLASIADEDVREPLQVIHRKRTVHVADGRPLKSERRIRIEVGQAVIAPGDPIHERAQRRIDVVTTVAAGTHRRGHSGAPSGRSKNARRRRDESSTRRSVR
mmetsp:Transcript_4531/g.12816  ORF Transcript_4531/g.12816 Transcript_4531/m.12816 type:complete len:211 (+) Transcript_4531:1129-1761(+)